MQLAVALFTPENENDLKYKQLKYKVEINMCSIKSEVEKNLVLKSILDTLQFTYKAK